jgi:hypothetical protein
VQPALEIPVALLVFNRPDTTARVFEAVRQARPRTLLVVSDGPRSDRPGEAERCAEVRSIVERVDWPCEVRRDISPTNLGCGRRISSGLDWVFREVDRAIVLEDDCLPHPDFFRFSATLLERYADDERVMMLGGTNFLGDRFPAEASYLFSRYFPVWGWATWRRAWAKYDFGMTAWPALRATAQVASFYPQPYVREHVIDIFDAAHRGAVDTWDYQWFHACLFNGGLCAIPRRNLVSNIGHAGAHPNVLALLELPVFPLEPGELVGPRLVFPDRRYDDAILALKFKRRRKLKRRLRDAIRAFLSNGEGVVP